MSETVMKLWLEIDPAAVTPASLTIVSVRHISSLESATKPRALTPAPPIPVDPLIVLVNDIDVAGASLIDAEHRLTLTACPSFNVFKLPAEFCGRPDPALNPPALPIPMSP